MRRRIARGVGPPRGGHMSVEPDAASPARDSGLVALLLVSRFLGQAVDGDRLRREFGTPGQRFGTNQLLRAARSLGLKARCVGTRWDRLRVMPLPALARMRDGRWAV